MRNGQLAEKDVEAAILLGRTQGDGLVTESLAYAESMVLEGNFAGIIDLADQVARQKDDGRQGFREGAGGEDIARGWSG